MPLCPQVLGSFTTAVPMAAPAADTDGYACYGARYVNVWSQSSGIAPKYLLYVYFYRTGIGWIRYTDIPPVLQVLVSTNGLLAEIEVRGAERIYLRRVGQSAPNLATATITAEAFTYT